MCDFILAKTNECNFLHDMAPTLEPRVYTSRLILRSPELTDAPSLARLYSNPNSVKYEPPRPRTVTVEHYQSRIPGWHEMRKRGEAAFMIILKRRQPPPDSTSVVSASEVEEGEAIGMGGLNYVAIKDGVRVADIGVMIDSSEWRRGYGREALEATFDYAFGEAECDVVEMETMAINLPFQALAARMGLNQYRRSNADQTEYMYHITKAQWEEAKSNSKLSG